MLELLMSGNTKSSGLPGPSSIAYGDSVLGFYGEAPTEDFISGSDLASSVGLNIGTSVNSTEPWLKFSLDGKILYVCKSFYRERVNWIDLNPLGLVFGETTINVGEYTYKVRLLTGADADPSTVNPQTNPSGAAPSEWNKLLHNVSSNGTGSEDWSFDGYSESELGVGENSTIHWCQETNSGNSTEKVARGRYNLENFIYGSTTNEYANFPDKKWRPVLELVVPE